MYPFCRSLSWRVLCVVSISLIFFIGVGTQQVSAQQDEYYTRLRQIMTDLDNYMSKKGKQDEHVHQTYELVSEKTLEHDLEYGVDFENEKVVIGGAHFGITKDFSSKAYICLTTRVIDLYHEYPSIAWCLLIHEFRHAYDYFTNQDQFMQPHDLVRYYFDMDALCVEALFIQKYLKQDPTIRLIDFQEYLVASFEQDGLKSASMLFYKTDIHVAHEIERVFRNYENREDLQAVYSDLIDLGEACLQQRAQLKTQTDWEDYYTLVTLFTYHKYARQLFGLKEADDGTVLWEEVLARNETFTQVYKQIKDMVMENESVITKYYSDTISAIEGTLYIKGEKH